MALTARVRGGKPATAKPRTLRRGRIAAATPPRDNEALTAALKADHALHASAMYVEKYNAQDVRRLIQPWQAQAMSYYDLVPEVKFSANFFSQMLRKVRLYPALIDPDTHEPEEIHSGPVFDAFDKVKDRSGGREELQGSYGKLRFLIGEGYLTASPDEARGEIWEYLSPNELRVQPGGSASRFRAPMLSADQFIIGNDQAHIDEFGPPEGPAFAESGPDIIIVYRLWRSSPAYTDLADCNMKAAVDSGILEELVLSTYSVRAQLKSRMNQNGVWFVPEEISFASLGNDPEEDPTSDIFTQRLTEVMMASLSDPGSAEAMLPIVARVSAEFCDKANLVKFNDVQGDLAEINQRTEMIGRFATCIELPKEVVTGTADINHWGAWLISEETWDSYGAPAALEMASDFNAAYLQPTMREQGFADWQNVTIGIDPSAVINHPDKAKDADALYNGRAISKKVWRESKGYNDNDEMPDDELNEMLGVQIRDGSLAVYGIPSVRANIEPTKGDIESATGEVTSTTPADGTGSDIEKGAPQTGPDATAAQDTAPALQASAAMNAQIDRNQRILGAAEFAIQQGHTFAGAKLRSLTSSRGPVDARCAECQERIDGLPNWKVAATLGADTVQQVLASPFLKGGKQNLVDGTSQAFAAVLERMGVSVGWASQLGDLVEQHAARTLFDEMPEPLPKAFAALLRRIDLPLEGA